MKILKPNTLILSFFVFAVFIFPVAFALAVGGDNPTLPGGDNPRPPGGDNQTSVKLENPLGSKNSTFAALIKGVLDAALVIGLPVAVLFIVLAGFRFVWARGNATKLADARRNLVYTVIGIAVFFGAWTLATIIESTIRSLGGSI